jgi:hypothetical protein
MSLKINSPKINDPIKKWAQELNRTFSKEEVQKAKKNHEEMFNIPGYKGNANQNHIKIPLLFEYHQNTNNNNVGEDAGKQEPSYTAGGTVN